MYSSSPAFVVAGPMCPQHYNGGKLLTVIISGMSLMCLVKCFLFSRDKLQKKAGSSARGNKTMFEKDIYFR